MVIVSKEFRTRIKLHELPAYRIAQKAGIDPSTLSKLISGISTVRENDERIIRVAAVLGLSADEAFDRSENGIAGKNPATCDSEISNPQNTGTEND